VLPQVQAGLGIVSFLTAGCLLVLERLQPLFFAIAVAALAYQAWIVLRRPAPARTAGMKAALAASVVVNGLLIGSWIVLSIRYR
jgi:hypothetical protein